MREFVAPLCVKSHHYVRSISDVVNDGYLIVLIQHFQIIQYRLVATSGSPIQRLLLPISRSLDTNLKSSVNNSASRLESLLVKPSCHDLNTSETETIWLPHNNKLGPFGARKTET